MKVSSHGFNVYQVYLGPYPFFPGQGGSAVSFQGMDMDGNGHLSLEEMLEAYDHNPEFKNLMQQMDREIWRKNMRKKTMILLDLISWYFANGLSVYHHFIS